MTKMVKLKDSWLSLFFGEDACLGRRILDVPARGVPVGEGEVELLVPPQGTLARQNSLPRSALEPLFPL